MIYLAIVLDVTDRSIPSHVVIARSITSEPLSCNSALFAVISVRLDLFMDQIRNTTLCMITWMGFTSFGFNYQSFP